MLVTALIKRKLKQGNTLEAFSLMNEMRSQAMNQRGYVSGKTLIDQNDPRKVVVFSEWIGLENWTAWKESSERLDLEKKLEEHLEGPTEIEEYSLATYSTMRRRDLFAEGGLASRTIPGLDRI
jgi:heme-degrading monooxygenase HmoA